MAGRKKGSVPWNKGVSGYRAFGKKKGVCNNTGRTHFKKGCVAWDKGKKNPMSKETKRKISLTNKGIARNTGYKHTEEWKKERSEWAKKNSHIYKSNGLLGVVSQGRKNPTKIEKLIIEKLDKSKINHISQYLINNKFCVDEYLPELNTVIEVDGVYWHNLERIMKKDKAENAYLKKCGYKVIRIPEEKVSDFSTASLFVKSQLEKGVY